MVQCSSRGCRSPSSRVLGRISWFLSLPNLRNVREAKAVHDAGGWNEAMDMDMVNLKSHDVHELVPRVKDLHILKLGWACAGRSKTEFLTSTRPG